ncbi:MAG TPA: LuxR C-terminal-related transcriptional regulator, partial [Acidimicrobiales bacterium]|nr:LuxR C-terminal-related transcriptional regulator [Acidimicrobiales bacterium]
VFVSGFSLVAAQVICSGRGVVHEEVFGLLESLVEKSLVQASPRADRFRLHETMHAYSTDALAAEGGTTAVRNRHLDYFLELARYMEPKTQTSEFPSARRALGPELGNFRTALGWSLESKQADAGARLLGCLGGFLYDVGLGSEAVAQSERFLAEKLDPPCKAALLALSSRCLFQQDPSVALRLASELVSLGRSLADKQVQAVGLVRLGRMQLEADPHEAVEAAEEGLQLARETGEPLHEVDGSFAKGWALLRLGRPAEALAAGEAGLRAAEECDWPAGRCNASSVISYASTCTGDLARALELASQIIATATDPLNSAGGEALRAEVLAAQGKAEAIEVVGRALALALESGFTFFVALYEGYKGRILVSQGHDDEGCQALEAATADLESFGMFAPCVENHALLAEAAVRRGDLLTARRHLSASSWHLPRAPEPAGALILRAEARLARAEREPERAHGLACDGLGAAFEGGHVLWATDLLELVAVTCSDVGSPAEAARLLGAAERQRSLVGHVRSIPFCNELAPVVADLRAVLGEIALERVVREGRALSLEEAVGYARRGRGKHARPRSGWDSLTPSERKVALLVGQHLTNNEIARRLFVSTPTVKSHLNHVFAKLGTTNRGQLAAVAHRREV